MDRDQAAVYLTGHFDQAAAALAAGEPGQAAAVAGQIRRDGYPEVADIVLDGVIEAQRAGDHDSRDPAGDRYMMATVAHHVLGDLSRDEPDLVIIYGEEADHYVGEWATGIGFVNVRFPKATTRELTDDEKRHYGAQRLDTAGMVRPIVLDAPRSGDGR